MKQLVVGCPISLREWVLPRWFDHVEQACEKAGVQPHYAFVVDPKDPCVDIIRAHTTHYALAYVRDTRGSDERRWSAHRYQHMAGIRNVLLGLVRSLEPAYFLSLDSDILAHPFLVRDLIDDARIDGWDAVGGKTYLTPIGTKYPSWANLSRSGGLMRQDSGGYFPVQVIMAIKLMTPQAYQVDYEFHLQGEDTGWSLAAARAGLRLAWDGRIASKHVMNHTMLDSFDARVGF